jgi:hypothetical protein
VKGSGKVSFQCPFSPSSGSYKIQGDTPFSCEALLISALDVKNPIVLLFSSFSSNDQYRSGSCQMLLL